MTSQQLEAWQLQLSLLWLRSLFRHHPCTALYLTVRSLILQPVSLGPALVEKFDMLRPIVIM